MKTQLVIFDNDGVVVDSEALIKKALVETFAGYDVHFTKEWAFDNLQGLKPDDTFTKIQKLTDKILDKEETLAKYKVEFFERVKTMLKTTEGLLDIVQVLEEKNIKRCIATSGLRLETHKKYDAANLREVFPDNIIFTAEQVENGKPAPDLFLFAAKRMGFTPENTVVIEDSINGIIGAKAAGMRAIGYIGGSHAAFAGDDYADKLRAVGADHVIKHHDELLGVINA